MQSKNTPEECVYGRNNKKQKTQSPIRANENFRIQNFSLNTVCLTEMGIIATLDASWEKRFHLRRDYFSFS
jgi:hypothetical protein